MKISITPEKYPYYTFPKMAALVTVMDKEKQNIITLAWHSPLSFKPPLYGISIDSKRHSHNLIMDSKEFVVNFAPFSIVDKLHYCGRHSGRNVDKFRETGLTPMPAEKVNAPLIKECYSHLECRLAETKKCGDHTLFVGEVVNVAADENAFDKILKNVLPVY